MPDEQDETIHPRSPADLYLENGSKWLEMVDGNLAKRAGNHALTLQLALMCMLWGLSVTPVCAHPMPFSYIDLQLSRNQLEGKLVIRVMHLAHELNEASPKTLLDPVNVESKREAILNLLRPNLQFAGDGRALDLEFLGIQPDEEREALVLNFRLSPNALPAVLGVRCTLFTYDPEHVTYLNIYEGTNLVYQEIFSRDHTTLDYFTDRRQAVLAVVKKFIPAGVYHIFTGPDHILFIIGLLLMGGSLLRLLSIVTAFTIAHSITLSLAALDVLNPPARLIEPAIALSIVFVGIDNLMVREGGRDIRAWVAFFFGLVHGFGFAGVLREFGLPRQALGWSLFSFNFGVEIGQACIVLVVALLLTALRSRNQLLGRRIAAAGSIGVILAGSYWFVQRVFF